MQNLALPAAEVDGAAASEASLLVPRHSLGVPDQQSTSVAPPRDFVRGRSRCPPAGPIAWVTKGGGSEKGSARNGLQGPRPRAGALAAFNGHELVTRHIRARRQVQDGIKVIDDDTTTTDEGVAA
jgi:hypothetical protein